MPRIVAVRLPDEVYRELVKRSREEGYTLVADYVRDIILRELGKPVQSMAGIERRLEKLEEGELPPRLYERIWSIAQSAAQEIIGEKGVVEQVGAEKILQRVERRLQDLVNPWTSKIDSLAARLAEVIERLESLEERVRSLEERLAKQQRQQLPGAVGERSEREHYTGKPRRKSAIERLREQGAVFESDVQWLRDRDAFFERLAREGALVFEIGGERVAVDPDYWRSFKEKLEELPTSNDEEIRILLTEPQYRLFKLLRENGLIYFDSTKKSWHFVEEPAEQGKARASSS